MGKIHGPSTGYDNPAKNAWRSWVWSHIGGVTTDKLILPGHRKVGVAADGSIRQARTGNVLLMPSLDRTEILEAAARGFAPEELHLVDHNRAVVATHQSWLKSLESGRRFRTYGMPVWAACERMATNGVELLAANLDFCGSLSVELWRGLTRCWQSGVLDSAMVFVTILRGREDHLTRQFYSPPTHWAEFVRAHSDRDIPDWWTSEDGLDPTPLDYWRLWALLETCGHTRRWQKLYAYCSTSGQSFLTVAFGAGVFPAPTREETECVIGEWWKWKDVIWPVGKRKGETFGAWWGRLTDLQRKVVLGKETMNGMRPESVFRAMPEESPSSTEPQSVWEQGCAFQDLLESGDVVARP